MLDFGPAIAKLLMGLENDVVFFLGEFLLVDNWVELVVIAFATLFAGAIFDVFGNAGPVADALGLDEDPEEAVLALSPGPFELRRFADGLADFGDLGGIVTVG